MDATEVYFLCEIIYHMRGTLQLTFPRSNQIDGVHTYLGVKCGGIGHFSNAGRDVKLGRVFSSIPNTRAEASWVNHNCPNLI